MVWDLGAWPEAKAQLDKAEANASASWWRMQLSESDGAQALDGLAYVLHEASSKEASRPAPRLLVELKVTQTNRFVVRSWLKQIVAMLRKSGSIDRVALASAQGQTLMQIWQSAPDVPLVAVRSKGDPLWDIERYEAQSIWRLPLQAVIVPPEDLSLAARLLAPHVAIWALPYASDLDDPKKLASILKQSHGVVAQETQKVMQALRHAYDLGSDFL